ncbi:unnamed protein product [Cyclocybe aegerita]|uniref:RING-type domain-containing protein n=1 Tax=Cyclocybe aegerita TaxID=1973307 RepID=A0A8S0XZP8_CYCAE|nr:unnamed protein product [Cyclocybe aegerita]
MTSFLSLPARVLAEPVPLPKPRASAQKPSGSSSAPSSSSRALKEKSSQPDRIVYSVEQMEATTGLLQRAYTEHKRVLSENAELEGQEAQQLRKDLALEREINTSFTDQILRMDEFMLDMGEALNCSICAERMDNPHIIPACGHTFCADCIEAWFVKQIDNHFDSEQNARVETMVYTCPTCRTHNRGWHRENFALKALSGLLSDYLSKQDA